MVHHVGKGSFLEFTGQTTDEVLACSESHDHVSLLLAFEWGLQAKARALGSDVKLNPEERLVLSVLALDREVNNGGFDQYFRNSSHRFAPQILDNLGTIGCSEAAPIVGRALAALGLTQITVAAIEKAMKRKDPVRDKALTVCDDEFFQLTESTDKLFAFVVANRDRIRVDRTTDFPYQPKWKKPPASSLLRNSLTFWKRGWDPTIEEAKAVARKIAQVRAIPAEEVDFEAAAVLFCFSRAIHFRDEKRATALSIEAFSVVRDDPVHQIEHKNWVELLLAEGLDQEADSATLDYLLFLKSGGRKDVSEIGQKNSIVFWARLLKEHRKRVPRSVKFFESNFPEIKLEEVQPSRIMMLGKRPKGKVSFKFLSELPEFSPDS